MAAGGHIFVSHSVDDRNQVDEIVRHLESRGIRIWIAPRDIRPGIAYPAQTQEAIEQCAGFVVVVTQAANESDFVPAETEMAFTLRKPIFPVRFAEIRPMRGLGLFIGIRHWTDAFGPTRNASLERLVQELTALTGSESPPPSPSPHPSPPPTDKTPYWLAGGLVVALLLLVLIAVSGERRTYANNVSNDVYLDQNAFESMDSNAGSYDNASAPAYDPQMDPSSNQYCPDCNGATPLPAAWSDNAASNAQ